MRERELKGRCRKLLNRLDIRPPLDVVELCERVGGDRGRPIHLIAYPIPVPGPFGAWLARSSSDIILYQAETSRPHQNHIILHELGHILADHAGDDTDMEPLLDPVPTADLRDRFPDLDPAMVRRALRRTSYDNEIEQEAEFVATQILEWASVLDRVAPRLLDDGTLARRYDDALIDRMGWL
jgi:hypothetical protein